MSITQPDRRGFLRTLVSAGPAAALAVGAAPAVGHAVETPEAPGPAYAPRYFTAAEWRFLQAAADILIPADENGPGGATVGIPEFIDGQMEMPYGHGKLWFMGGPFHPEVEPELGYQLNLVPRDIYRLGIGNFDAWCAKTHGKPFADLAAAEQIAAMHELESGRIVFADVPSATFFGFLLTNTKEGFFADPIYGGNKGMASWKMIGFPGVRADYMDWIDRPNAAYPYGPVSISGERA
ncbi:gluconate 2-dehydrogenase subunit 3 family protein [Gluconacetobacter azotocaptans]|uniref:gluconate 2-dehydrogenase subunit 3 family protein n=1 Tax=Gluconacetobacter azotocaptans TaxID=142834 RepID=UPI0030B85A77